MDALDQKLVAVFDGRVIRKDLLHRIKQGTNVPTFVLEFLLARYCASDDAAEIQVGMEAVLATLQDNYVRPDEANARQFRFVSLLCRFRASLIPLASVDLLWRCRASRWQGQEG